MKKIGRAAAGAVCAVMVPGVGFAIAANLQAPAARSGYAPVNGLRMYYEIHGGGGKAPPLVLLHGGGSTIGTSFGEVLPVLAATRQVVAFEQQGHGRTADIADRPFTFEQSADDAAALLRHLGITKADFFGYSNGGHIALELAIRHPGLVRKLVIESAMFDRDGCDPGFWKSFEGAKPDDMPRELREAYLAAAPHPEDLPAFFAKSVRRMLNFQGWTQDDLRSIRAPTLVMVGDRDIVLPEHAVRMFRLLPDARLAVLPGTDHMAIVSRTDWRATMIGTFLDSPMPPARPGSKPPKQERKAPRSLDP